MPGQLPELAWIVGAYLLGAVPFGYLIGRLHGVDIRQHGSRNIGATNVGRVVGRRAGLLCLALDIAKGLAPTLVYGLLRVPAEVDAGGLGWWLGVGVAAVLGHLFPVYLGFRGGKGVATTIGVALGIFPFFTVAMAVAVIGYFLVRYATGAVSAGSLTLAVLFPAALAVYVGLIRPLPLERVWPLFAVALLLGLLILVRHRENIRRLWRGEELSVQKKS
jgi:glycerol-3-phosphate acyltransferase PlsY